MMKAYSRSPSDPLINKGVNQMLGTIEPYINFKGNAKEAFDFYAEVFELQPPEIMTYKDMPPQDQDEMKDMIGEDQVMHGAVDFNGTLLMGSDTTDMMFEEGRLIQGNNFYLSWSSENAADVKKVFDRFVQGGATVIMPLEETFWAPLYGMVRDPFGVQWMIQNWIREEPEK